MLMFHGTCSSRLPLILERGLVCRGESESNWSNCESRKDAVYLTDSYALHFAEQATDGSGPLLIVEVDVSRIPEFFLGPDEDFLEQVTRSDPDFSDVGKGMVDRTKFFATSEWFVFCHLWKKSIEGLGSCCVKQRVSLSAITRYALVPRRSPLIRMSDPSISLMNYAICGAYYRNLMRYVFGNLDFEPDHTMNSSSLLEVPRDGIEVCWVS